MLSFSPDLIPYYGVELSGIRYSSIRGVNNHIKEMSSHTSARLSRRRRSIFTGIQIRREGTVPVNQVLIAIHKSRESIISVVRQGAPMTYSIELLSGNNAHQWEEFNAHSREGTLFHNLRWKEILEEEFGLNLKYYLIRDDRKVIGICPFIARSVGLFQGLESIPHSEYTNAILDDSFDASQIDHLLSLFKTECSFLQIDTYNPEIPNTITYSNFLSEDAGNMVLNLKQKPPEVVWETLSKKTIKSIRRFDKEGFEIHELSRRSDIEQFYRYYAKNVAHIKGEILPLTFFERLWDAFSPGELRVAVLVKNDLCAGGTLALLEPVRKTVYYEYLALNRDLPHYTPDHYLSWDLIKWASDNDYEKISFGRQRLDPDNPRFRYKAKFRAEHIPIHSRLVIFSKAMSMLYQLKRTLLRSA